MHLRLVLTAVALTSMLACAAGDSQQSNAPRLGPDTARFRLTVEQQLNNNAGSGTLAVRVDLRWQVETASGDTLRALAIVDSVGFSMKGFGRESNDGSSLGFEHGDSVEALITTRGHLVRRVRGKEQLHTVLAVFVEIPADERRDSTWQGPPVLLGVGPLNWDPAFNAITTDLPNFLREHTTARLTWHGGGRSWSVATETNVSDVRHDISGIGAFFIRSLKSTGDLIVNSDGRITSANSTTTARSAATLHSMPVNSESTTTVRLERIR